MEHLPEEFQDATREEQTQIAQLGIQCWTILKKEVVKIKDLDYTKLSEKLKEEGRKEGKREGEKEVNKLLKEKEYAFDDLQAQFKSLEKKLQRLDTEKQKELEELEKKLKKESERERDATAREAIIAERSNFQQQFQQQIKDYEVRIAQLSANQDWKLAWSENQKMVTKLEEQLANLTKIRTSYEIGQEGEEETENMLYKIPEWDCERVSKEKDRADFRMTSKDKKSFILDSKKYTSVVPKKERDKLMSNVDDDATVSGGILVSLDSKITTKENCELETTPGKKIVCYLNLVGMTNEAKIAYIGSTLKFLHQYVASKDEREKNEMLERMMEGTSRIGELKKETENMRNKAKELYESLKINVGKIQSIMDYILNKSVQEEVAAPAISPSGRKRKESKPST
jgi:hypothetical protein